MRERGRGGGRGVGGGRKRNGCRKGRKVIGDGGYNEGAPIVSANIELALQREGAMIDMGEEDEEGKKEEEREEEEEEEEKECHQFSEQNFAKPEIAGLWERRGGGRGGGGGGEIARSRDGGMRVGGEGGGRGGREKGPGKRNAELEVMETFDKLKRSGVRTQIAAGREFKVRQLTPAVVIRLHHSDIT